MLLADLAFTDCSKDSPPQQATQTGSSQGSWSKKAPMPIQVGEVTAAAGERTNYLC